MSHCFFIIDLQLSCGFRVEFKWVKLSSWFSNWVQMSQTEFQLSSNLVVVFQLSRTEFNSVGNWVLNSLPLSTQLATEFSTQFHCQLSCQLSSQLSSIVNSVANWVLNSFPLSNSTEMTISPEIPLDSPTSNPPPKAAREKWLMIFAW